MLGSLDIILKDRGYWVSKFWASTVTLEGAAKALERPLS